MLKVVIVVAALAAVARATFASASSQQVHDQRRLAERLSAMGMFELLEGYAQEAAKPEEARYLLAKSKLTHADSQELSPDRRAALVDEAIGLLQELEAEIMR